MTATATPPQHAEVKRIATVRKMLLGKVAKATSIIFDVETGPLDDETIWSIVGEFDEAEVKCGNLKDGAKIAAKIEESREKFYDQARKQATLHAATSEVLCIGYLTHDSKTGDDQFHIDCAGTEQSLLENFWRVYSDAQPRGCRKIGCNIFDFDLPCLMRRSMILNVEVPQSVMDGNRRYFAQLYHDVRQHWLCGQYKYDCPSSLDYLARAFGVGAKNGSGADFHALWKSDKAAAIEYLKNDLRLAFAVAERMGLVV